MPGRIMPGVTASDRKKAIRAADERKSQQAEALFEKMIQQGLVTPANIQKVKEQIARKTGAWPLGGTN